MRITDYLKENNLYLDGGMGTLLQERGLTPGELPERWNISSPDVIRGIHLSYYESGSNVVSTNTFGANILKYSEDELDKIVKAAVENARHAQKASSSEKEKWVALDIGPTGRMLKPYGDLDFEDAVEVFAKTVRLGVKYGVDLILIETMTDSYETKAAVLAAKENSELPIFVSNAYGEDGKLLTGATPPAMVAMLEGLSVDAIGANCSLGPKALSGVVSEYLKYSSLPVILKPNAGLPRQNGGETVYDVLPEEFAEEISVLMKQGVSVVGGCCGTTPEYISALTEKTCELKRVKTEAKNYTVVSSYTHAQIFDGLPVIIGERINPTGKKRFKEALRSNDTEYILNEAIGQQNAGAHILDVNVGLPEIDECAMLIKAVTEIQTVTDLPLQIDTSNPAAMERAARYYNGKPMLNSVNGKAESMAAVFPIAKRYGGLTVALTLDESGIPKTAEERLLIAERILKRAQEYGIDKKDLIFDPLAMAVSADPSAAVETLRAVELITKRLGCKTSLGISNVSFGLPSRDIITASYLTQALSKGLSAAIMNPFSVEVMKSYRAYAALMGLDEGFSAYIDFASSVTEPEIKGASASKASEKSAVTSLADAICKGLRDSASSLTEELLKSKEPLEIISSEIVPALDAVGNGFEKGTVYLPGLLMSAEAAKAAFEKIKATAISVNATKFPIVIATVKGDIHDIGKNIVKLLLENYGYRVIDLGHDVAPEVVASAVEEYSAPLVGLSALMTTTVPAMKETIELIRARAPKCRVMVGGAVLTEEYANMIGADAYAKDALGAVRYAETLNNENK